MSNHLRDWLIGWAYKVCLISLRLEFVSKMLVVVIVGVQRDSCAIEKWQQVVAVAVAGEFMLLQSHRLPVHGSQSLRLGRVAGC